MDAHTFTELRARLQADLDRLQAEVEALDNSERSTLSESSGENAYRDHMADQGSATFERELDMTLEENLRIALAEVRSALERMDAGTYGKCERCGQEIPVERMQARPTAGLCITCKSADERR